MGKHQGMSSTTTTYTMLVCDHLPLLGAWVCMCMLPLSSHPANTPTNPHCCHVHQHQQLHVRHHQHHAHAHPAPYRLCVHCSPMHVLWCKVNWAWIWAKTDVFIHSLGSSS